MSAKVGTNDSVYKILHYILQYQQPICLEIMCKTRSLREAGIKTPRTFIQTTTVKTTVHTEQKNTAVCYTHSISSSFDLTDKQD